MTATPRKDSSALIIVDMQNGFCHAEGSFAQMGMDIGALSGAIPGCLRLVDLARAAAVPIIYTRYIYRSDYRDGGVLVDEILPALAESKSLAEGSWDAAIVDDLEVQPGDFIVDKNRYSAFYGTRLEPMLTSMGIRDLVIAGVTTNMCVETTARDAGQRDYRVFVAKDACGELDRSRHDTALQTIAFGFGWVTDVDGVEGAWS